MSEELVDAGRVLAREGLVDAFGHVSLRVDDRRALITPPRPLGELSGASELLELPLTRELDELPAGLPREAWMHWAALGRLPDARAICRAQPPSVLAVGALVDELPALFGQAALVGAPVPVFDDAHLVRDRQRGLQLAEVLAGADATGRAVILRGNGAVTAGSGVGQAVSRMVLLERSAHVVLQARAAGEPSPLTREEAAAWADTGDELLERLWQHLRSRA